MSSVEVNTSVPGVLSVDANKAMTPDPQSVILFESEFSERATEYQDKLLSLEERFDNLQKYINDNPSIFERDDIGESEAESSGETIEFTDDEIRKLQEVIDTYSFEHGLNEDERSVVDSFGLTDTEFYELVVNPNVSLRANTAYDAAANADEFVDDGSGVMVVDGSGKGGIVFGVEANSTGVLGDRENDVNGTNDRVDDINEDLEMSSDYVNNIPHIVNLVHISNSNIYKILSEHIEKQDDGYQNPDDNGSVSEGESESAEE